MHLRIVFLILGLFFSNRFLEAGNQSFCVGFNALEYQSSSYVDEVKIDGNQFFWGLQFRYEYRPPKGIYFGFDAFGTIMQNEKSFFLTVPSQNTSIRLINGLTFGGVEFRLGYTFDQDTYLISPFLSIGRYRFDRVKYIPSGYEIKNFYLAGGFLATYELNRFLNVGLKAKALLIDHDANVHFNDHHFKKKSTECGFEVAVPCSFHLYKEILNLKLEPYFLTLSVRNKNFAYGSNLLLELSF